MMLLGSWLLGVALVAGQAGGDDVLDLVIRGGRVMDPESGTDAVRDVGITGSSIARVSEGPLAGRRVLDAKGLVVAPGFIDLHQHGQNEENDRLKLLDGVTTALELEIGVPEVGAFLKAREGRARDGRGGVRGADPRDAGDAAGRARRRRPGNRRGHQLHAGRVTPRDDRDLPRGGRARRAALAPHPGRRLQRARLERRVGGRGDRRGGRDGGDAPHRPHQQHGPGAGLRVPAHDRGRERMRLEYSDLRLVATGEPLSKESFDRLRASSAKVSVLVRGNPDERVNAVIRHPLVMIASDGFVSGGKGHPRTAGTYSRILKRYVRELRSVTLMDAIRKMSLMPAQRLEAATPQARGKGRIREGADADIVVFNPETVADQSTYEEPSRPSTGFQYVLVGGTPVVDGGRLVEAVRPGRALTGR